VGIFRDELEHGGERARERARAPQLLAKGRELRRIGQLAVHDEMGYLLVACLRGEFLDGVAAVVKPVSLLVREAYRRFIDNDALQPACKYVTHSSSKTL